MTSTVTPAVYPLSWEKNHPERHAWSQRLYGLIDGALSVFETAKDIKTIRPDYQSLNRQQRIAVLCEFICWVAYYECGWNPESNEKDVGTDDKDTWSVGLLQLSVVDQLNYHLPLGFDFGDLQNPIKNLELGVDIMCLQIHKHGKVLIPAGESGVYWATIHPGGKYDKSKEIIAKVQGLKFS